MDIHVCREMTIRVKLINISVTSHSYHFCVCVVRTLRIYSHSKFPVFNTVLTIVPMLYWLSRTYLSCITETVPFDQYHPISCTPINMFLSCLFTVYSFTEIIILRIQALGEQLIPLPNLDQSKTCLLALILGSNPLKYYSQFTMLTFCSLFIFHLF